MSRADRIRRANETLAERQQWADANRAETEEGLRNARGSRYKKPDNDFIRNWKPLQDADQKYYDELVREAAQDLAKAKRRWF